MHDARRDDALADRKFGDEFENHVPALAARIRRMLPPTLRRKESVSDVLQETRITAFARRADFEDRGDGAMRAWLLRIAELKATRAVRRHAGTKKRAAGREVTRDARLDTREFAARGPTPSEAAIGAETAAAVRRAMLELPDDYRTVLSLTRIQGLTLVDAAKRIGRSHEATKKLYARALSKFTEAFDRTAGRGDG
jgi:RNA polymerase sigma-70 factor (ECF subfamily)